MSGEHTAQWRRRLLNCDNRVGRVTGASLLRAEIALPGASLGDRVWVQTRQGPCMAEVIEVSADRVTAQWVDGCASVRTGSTVYVGSPVVRTPALRSLAGRVLRVSEFASQPETMADSGEPNRPAPRKREPTLAVGTGLGAVDAMLPLVRGQRTVLMAGSGVGKSSLLRLLAASWAGRVLVALVGEREREAMEWERWIRDSVHVAIAESAGATIGDRLQTLPVVSRLAECAAADGEHVLVLVDSMTRWTRAAVQVTDPAASPRTLPLWVRERLARFVEGCGAFERGSITLVMAVLTERDDVHDPLADELRSLTDAHWVLDRGRSEAGAWPPFDMLRSVTRLAHVQGDETIRQARESLRQALALVERSRDAIDLGIYRRGDSADVDLAMDLERGWTRLSQRVRMDHGAAERELLTIMQPWMAARAQVSRGGLQP
jgi:flagellum-specific ATP synthase